MPDLDSTMMSTEASRVAFRKAIASSMIGVRTRDVMIISASSMNVRRGLNDQNIVDESEIKSELLRPAYSLRALAGTLITWNVTVSLIRLHTNGSYGCSSLGTRMKTAVGTGLFLTSLKKLSASFGAVTSTSVKLNPCNFITVSRPTAAPTSSPTITAVIPSITLNVTAFRTNVTLSILLTKTKIVPTDISGRFISRSIERKQSCSL
jgi:hypothetical protein